MDPTRLGDDDGILSARQLPGCLVETDHWHGSPSAVVQVLHVLHSSQKVANSPPEMLQLACASCGSTAVALVFLSINGAPSRGRLLSANPIASDLVELKAVTIV